jgi:hypothetical protein
MRPDRCGVCFTSTEWLREPVKTMPLKQVVILDTCAAGGASNDLAKLAERRDVSPDQRRAIELLKDATDRHLHPDG